MNVVCHAASPFADSSLCRWFKQCEEATSPDPGPVILPGVGSVDPPEGVVWVEPGINLDNRWMAEIGKDVRGLADLGAGGVRSRLRARLSELVPVAPHPRPRDGGPELGLAEFWQAVKDRGVTREQYKTPTAPWEDFSQIPYRFISAGPYPPSRATTTLATGTCGCWSEPPATPSRAPTPTSCRSSTGCSSRCSTTACPPPRHPWAGAPIRTLDQTLLGRNDFEAGDVAAYMIGPLDQAPHTVALAERRARLRRDDHRGVRRAVEVARRRVGVGARLLQGAVGLPRRLRRRGPRGHRASTLSALGPGARHGFVLDCDGKSEGRYLIHGYVEGTSVTGTFPNGVPWRRYLVRFDTLQCIKESDWDRFTPSDEPFVLGLVIPHGGPRPMVSWRTAPYADVDTGETRAIGTTFTVEVPQRYGFISLACAVYESDDETPNDRDRLLAEFSRKVGVGIVQPEDSFFEVLGESIAAGWRIGSVEAVAFRRSPTVEVRSYQPRTFDRWVEGGDRVEWTLGEPATWTAEVPDTISCDCAGCTDDVIQPPVKPDTTRIDHRRKPGDKPPKRVKDPGREIPIDLAELDPRCRRPIPVDDSIGEIDEPPVAPRPSDGCP